METFNHSDATSLLAEGSVPPANRMGAFLETCSLQVPTLECGTSGNRLSGLEDGSRREEFWSRLGEPEGSEKSFRSAESGSDDLRMCSERSGEFSTRGNRVATETVENKERGERNKAESFTYKDTTLMAKWEIGCEEGDEKTVLRIDESCYLDSKATTSDIRAATNVTFVDKDGCMAWSVRAEDLSGATKDDEETSKTDEASLTDRERILRDFSDEVFLGQGVKRAKVDRDDRPKRAKLYDETPTRNCLYDGRLPTRPNVLSLDSTEDEFAVTTDEESNLTCVSPKGSDFSSNRYATNGFPTDRETNVRPSTGHRSVMMTNQELNIACGFPGDGYRSPPGSLLMLSPAGRRGSCRKQRGGPTVRLSSPAPQPPPQQEAETVYEFTEDATPDSCEKLSSYRRRRLADKKYEFCEEGEDAENIVPYRIHRKRDSSPCDR